MQFLKLPITNFFVSSSNDFDFITFMPKQSSQNLNDKLKIARRNGKILEI